MSWKDHIETQEAGERFKILELMGVIMHLGLFDISPLEPMKKELTKYFQKVHQKAEYFVISITSQQVVPRHMA